VVVKPDEGTYTALMSLDVHALRQSLAIGSSRPIRPGERLLLDPWGKLEKDVRRADL
jgi:hypothetical protein